MVVLPAEKRFDWKYPPIMLFTIIILNILVFLLYQSGDKDRFELSMHHYFHSGLLRMEWPAYQEYLREQQEIEYLQEVQRQHQAENYQDIIQNIVLDDEFSQYLDEHGQLLKFNLYDESDNWENWRRQRDELDKRIASLSYLAYGLTPNQLNPLTLFTHQFLHGDFMHLLGNMVFLIICGFAVEAAIGSGLFLLLYLTSGVAGGLFFALLDLSSDIPLVGASGAISGVMAMYLAIFRLRQIDFFYWVFIFAGYFRAPALLLLPVYIGKELFDFFTNENSNVAFMAHAGGFISGGLLILLAHYKKPELINNEYIEQNQITDPKQDALAQVYHLLDEMKFSAALKAIHHFIAEYGIDFDSAYLRYHLAKALDHQVLEKSFDALMSLRIRDPEQLDKLAKSWTDNPELHSRVESQAAIKLALQLSTEEHISVAEDIFQQHYHPHQTHSSLGVLARKLSVVFGKRNQADKQQHYDRIADQCISGEI